MPEKDFIKYPTGKIKKGEFCEYCATYNARNTTCSVIAYENKKILLIKRGTEPLKRWWALPGGYLDWDETLEECALRELREETGYDGKKTKLFMVNSKPNRSKDGKQNVDHVFIIENLVKKYDFDKNEIEEVEWFSLDKIPEKIAFDHIKPIEEFKKSLDL
jgi:8-oxo-dGTP diphosphatase